MAIVFIPSLQHMTIVKLVITACEHPDTLPFMYSDRNEDEFRHFFNNDRAMTVLPALLKTRSILMLKALRSEIKFWRDRYSRVLCLATVENFVDFSWRSEGTIDSLKTAETLVRNENLPFCCRFYLACCHFLGNDALDLWNRTPAYRRFYLIHRLNRPGVMYAYFLPWFQSGASTEFLAHSFKPSNISDEFFLATLWKAEVSFQCFVERLPMDYRIDWLKRIVRRRYLDRDTTHFIVRGSVRNQEISIFKENALSALCNFLSWPLQNIFVEVAKHLWSHLSGEDFLELLNNICNKTEETDFNYLDLLREFWNESPQSYKTYVDDRLKNTDGEFTNMKSIFRDHLSHSFEI